MPSVDLYCRVHVRVYLRLTKCGQISVGSRDAYYNVLFDDSAFLFYQREMNQQEKLIQMNKSCYVREVVTE